VYSLFAKKSTPNERKLRKNNWLLWPSQSLLFWANYYNIIIVYKRRMKMKNANKLEIYYSNFELEYKVNNIDEAYKIVSDLLNNPNIEMVDLLDITVFYNGDPNIIEMVE
jgi:hypothetical protein